MDALRHEERPFVVFTSDVAYYPYYMKNVLITGGMGFIGRALSRKLLATTDYHLTIVDNLSSCRLDPTITENKRVTFIDADLSNWNPQNEHYDQIYHLAGPVGPLRVLEVQGRILPIIISQLEKISRLAIEMNAKLMFISTSEVYGAHAKEKISENVDPIVAANVTPRLEYGIAKLAGEIMLKNLSAATTLRYNCVRPFNIIGPGQNDKSGFVIPRFVRLALHNEPITVYGSGNQIRTFTHISDFIDALYTVMESDISGEVFNIGNPEGTLTVLELATRIKNALKSSSEIIFVDPEKLHGRPFHDAWDKIPDISKITGATGWTPQWSLEKVMQELSELRDRYLV